MNDEDKRRRYAKLDKEMRDSAVSSLLQHKNGRKYLWWLMQIGGIGAQPYRRNALDTAFNCGTLDVGQQILAHVTEVDPAGFVQMQKENQDEWSTRYAAGGNADDADAYDSDY